jgi:hypothetical protein
MDHLSHSLPRQSQATQFQFDLHRRSRPSAIRLQGRLPRRILRRCPAHRSPSNLRGCLCPSGYSGRLETRISPAPKSAAVDILNPAPRRRTQALPCVPPCPLCLKPLTLTLTFKPLPHNCERPSNLRGHLCPSGYSGRLETRISPAPKSAPVDTLNPAPRPRTQALPCVPPCPLCLKPLTLSLTLTFKPLPHNCERPVNPSCGKKIHHPRTKPVIVEDTTHGVSLLTGTISGSNFAIPWPCETGLAGTRQVLSRHANKATIGRMAPGQR